ncbi:hypothetical protein LJB99_02900 [Deltaproteobacteria bacterium OttesenSCG-928-K17]|nr:hypothetical protein [Deltaproteobacteria bacterium OttesenSCG-928-K17]
MLSKWTRERLGLPYKGGWLPLIIEAEALAEKYGAAVYVKDKFGALSTFWKAFNPPPSSVSLYGMGRAIEKASYAVCQFCGNDQSVTQTPGPWVYTLCPECMEMQNTPDGPEQEEKVLAAIERLKACLASSGIPFEDAFKVRPSESYERSQTILS